MSPAVWTYPQDLLDEGPDEALATMAGLGIDELRLAVSYHRAEVVTPRSRSRRLLRTADGVHFTPEPSLYGAIRPVRPAGSPPVAPALLRRARAAGFRTSAWVVIANNTCLAERHPDAAVRNAWGDRLPSSLCVGDEDVRAYAVALVRDVAAQCAVDELLLEAWHHRRLADSMARQLTVVPPDDPLVQRAAWCFCGSCSARLTAAGVDPVRAADAVRRDRVDPLLAGRVDAVRREIVTTLVTDLVAAAGETPVRLFVPGAWESVGIDVGAVSAVAGVAVACYADTARAVAATAATVAAAIPPGASLEVALRPRDPFGPEPSSDLAAAAEGAVTAPRLSFYQYGQMASAALRAIATITGGVA